MKNNEKNDWLFFLKVSIKQVRWETNAQGGRESMMAKLNAQLEAARNLVLRLGISQCLCGDEFGF